MKKIFKKHKKIKKKEEKQVPENEEMLHKNRRKFGSIDYRSSFTMIPPALSDSLLSLPPGMTPALIARIHALKRLQMKTIELDAKFHEKVLKMEEIFQKEHDEIFKERCDIINGKWDDLGDLNKSRDIKDIWEELIEATNSIVEPESINGVPDFWLIVLRSIPGDLVKEWDEDVLRHLYDVKYRTQTVPHLSFILEFFFSPNEFFENEILEKEYFLKCTPDVIDPFSFDGPVIIFSKGTEILWKRNKNVTVQVERDRYGKKYEVKVDSFFNFFDPPQVFSSDSDTRINSEQNTTIEADFQIGHYLKDCVIPRAVLFYTGIVQGDLDPKDNSRMGSLTMIYKNPLDFLDDDTEDNFPN